MTIKVAILKVNYVQTSNIYETALTNVKRCRHWPVPREYVDHTENIQL